MWDAVQSDTCAGRSNAWELGEAGIADLVRHAAADWDPSSEDVADESLWEKDWDDDTVTTDFAAQLREELSKTRGA